MAYDRVIDSTKLNGAMTATANAIRGKTGGWLPIAWDTTTGFATAIEAISSVTSGSSNVATGSVGIGWNDTTTNVSGLGFQPTKVIIYLDDLSNVTDEQKQWGYFDSAVIFSVYNSSTGTGSFIVSIDYYEAEYEDGETYEDCYINGRFVGNTTITPTSDGFTISSEGYGLIAGQTYGYVAIA